MRLFSTVWLWVIGTVAFSQDIIISTENVKVRGKVMSTSGQLVHYRSNVTNKLDSIATDAVREIYYKDSVRVLVVPIARRRQTDILTFAEFQEALTNDNYALLLHGKTSRYDMRFTIPANNRAITTLTPDTKIKLTSVIDLLKSRPDFSFDITVHSDTIGKADLNQLLTDRQALALRNHLASTGLLMNAISVSGRGETDIANSQQPFSRRIDFRCTAIKGIAILYAEKYIPPKRTEPVALVQSNTTQENLPVQLDKPKSKKLFSMLAYAEGLYTLPPLSGDWTDADKGLGILQGYGGGALFTYYLKPRLGITAQIGYSYWAVKQRYVDDNQVVAYTSGQKLERLSAQIGVRVYITPAIYIQPIAGVQQLMLTNQNSAIKPVGAAKSAISTVLPSGGGAVGYEITVKKILIDLALQYHVMLNKDFGGITQPLHFAGLRLGLGYLHKKKISE